MGTATSGGCQSKLREHNGDAAEVRVFVHCALRSGAADVFNILQQRSSEMCVHITHTHRTKLCERSGGVWGGG